MIATFSVIRACRLHVFALAAIVALCLPLTAGLSAIAARPDKTRDDPAATTKCAGVVVDQDGKPVAGVSVRATPLDDGDETRQTRTDDTGRFEFSGLLQFDPEHTSRYLVFEHPDYALAWRSLTAVEAESPNFDATQLRVTLLPGVEFGGLVRDDTGRPIANAEVAAHLKRSVAVALNTRKFHYYTVTVTTDDQGWFQLAKLPNGTELELQVRHPDFVTFRQQKNKRGDHPTSVDDGSIEIRLSRGASIEGRLLADGKALEQAGVMIHASDPLDGKAAGWSRTDAEGRYRITHVTLKHPATVVGRVVDEDGRKVIPEMFVFYWADPARDAGIFPSWAADVARATVNDDGEFEVALPTGVLLGISVFSDGYEQAIFQPTDLEPGEVRDVGEIRLPPRAQRPATPMPEGFGRTRRRP